MNAVAQIIGFLGIPPFIIGIQIKQKRKLLILIIIANSLFVLSFIMLKAYPGALVCFIAIIETTFISYFESKKKSISNNMIIVLLLISIIGGLFTYHRLPDIIPIIGAILNTLLITNKKGRNIRRLSTIGALLFTTYDLIVGAYSIAIADAFIALSSLIAIIRYDIKK